jgi:hypothetical protein
MRTRKALGLTFIVLLFSLPAFGGEKEKITASQYGDKWPFTITEGDLECIDDAVILHTPSGTYNINGKAMSRYKDTYKSFQEIAKPVPGLENEPQAKMFPPSEMIQRGLKLCD